VYTSDYVVLQISQQIQAERVQEAREARIARFVAALRKSRAGK
jgi:hypothetical protein